MEDSVRVRKVIRRKDNGYEMEMRNPLVIFREGFVQDLFGIQQVELANRGRRSRVIILPVNENRESHLIHRLSVYAPSSLLEA